MTWIILGILLVTLLGTARLRVLRARREQELEGAERLRIARVVAAEDVTVFGEQLGELHVDTLTTQLDDAMRADYQQALDTYERAKKELGSARSTADVQAVLSTLHDGRFARASVLARRDGTELPTRREPCFFNPQHGPASTDVPWTPGGGVERLVPVCADDANRLANAELPQIRVVATAGGLMPWYQAEPWVAGAAGAARAHVASGRTPYTIRHLGEAHLRRGAGGANGAGGMGGGGVGI